MSSPYALTPDTPLARYRAALAAGDYQPDAAQQRAVEALDEIHRQWAVRWHTAGPAAWRTRLPHWLGGRRTAEPIVGLYLWGGVGRGKTWLMDLFFDTLPGQRKQRLHFHRFMLWVHESLADKQGQADPLSALADALKAQADVLCFDEFFVTDIGDAMLLGTLLPALFTRGVTLVATSNIPPAQLYPNGLQRSRFLPAIAQIQTHCQVLNVDGGTDYRLRTLTQAHLYLTPLGARTEQAMEALFLRLAGQTGQIGGTLAINHRQMPVLRRAEAVVALHFSALCEAPCSSRDYIALAQHYHTVLLHGVSAMGADREACARRFLALVDEFYERRVTLIISATCDMFGLYRGERLAFEYQRCLSRLQEMQSEAYLSLPHRP
ncbi:cell division protein ZapE [Edwardsiella piscicida]|uniref:cell division protein ZapE n=1 Tax=Edwardsiella piscicida TaxID=1263550 RepID=UPI00370DD2DC